MTVEEVEAALERELSFIREAARRPGEFGAAQQRYSLDAPAPSGFPTAVELRAVVNALVLRCAGALEATGMPAGPAATAGDGSADLFRRLCRLVEDEGRAHEELLSTFQRPRSRLLGSIFQNATASVNDDFWTAFTWDESMVCLCRSCGAPQEKARDYRCRYCGGHLMQGR